MTFWRRWFRRRGRPASRPDPSTDPHGWTGLLPVRDPASRSLLFEALRHGGQSLSYTENNPERFIVNCRDAFISRTLFVDGIDACEFGKFEIVHQILQQRESFPRVFDTLVDVGANIGVICIPAVARGHCRKAVAIEPHPENCRILRANIALNGLHDRIDVREAAASVQDGALLDLSISPVNAGDHRITGTTAPGRYGEETWATMQVPSMRLDALEPDLRSGSCLLWMDIQGCEGIALTGAGNLLERHLPLVLEFWPYGMARAGSFAALQESVSDYSGFYVVEESPQRHPIADLPLLWDRLGTTGEFVDILVT